FVDQFKNLAGGSLGLLERVVDTAHPADRIIQTGKSGEKYSEFPEGHLAAWDLPLDIKQHHTESDGADDFHVRRRNGLGPNPFQIHLGEATGRLFELAELEGFHSKGLDYPMSCDGLLQDVRDFLHLVLAGAASFANLSAEEL